MLTYAVTKPKNDEENVEPRPVAAPVPMADTDERSKALYQPTTVMSSLDATTLETVHDANVSNQCGDKDLIIRHWC